MWEEGRGASSGDYSNAVHASLPLIPSWPLRPSWQSTRHVAAAVMLNGGEGLGSGSEGGVGQLGMAHQSDGPASSLRMFGHVHRAMCGGGCQFEVLEEHVGAPEGRWRHVGGHRGVVCHGPRPQPSAATCWSKDLGLPSE